MDKKYKVLFIMVISMVLGYLPWYNFSAVSSFIQEDLNLSTREMGMILSIFQAGYVITVVFTGWIADKFGRKKVVYIATLLTGVFSIMFAFLAKDLATTMIFRILTGLSAGAIYAPGIALLTNWFDAKSRGLAIGAYTAAMSVSYAGGYFIAAPIAAASGWRQGILWTSLPAILAAVLLIIFVKENPNKLKSPTGQVESVGQKKNEYSKKLRRTAIILITLGYCGHMWELYTFWGWIGNFLSSTMYAQGFSLTEAVVMGGKIAASVILLGAVAVFTVSYISDKRDKEKMIIAVAIFSILGELAFGFAGNVNPNIIIVIAFWTGFWAIADSGLYKVLLTEYIDPSKTATFLGIQSAIGYSITIISPYVFGRVLEKANSGIGPIIEYSNWKLPFLIVGIGAMLSPISIIYLRKILKKEGLK